MDLSLHAHFGAPDSCVCKVAKVGEEISVQMESGFEYICEHEDLQFFKKPK